MIDLNLDSLFEEKVRKPKFKIADEIVDPTSGLKGTIIKVEDPIYSYMPYLYEVMLSNGKRSRF